MRVLISSVTYHPALNGQAIFTENLAEGLVKHGHAVALVYPTQPQRAQTKSRHGVRLEAVRSFSLAALHPESYLPWPSRKSLRRLFYDFQPEIVHIQDHYPASRAVVLEAKRRQIPVVGTNHFIPENLAAYLPGLRRMRPLYNWIMWKWMLEVYNRVAVVAPQSQAAGDILRANGLRVPMVAASCGIDLNCFYPDPAVDRAACRQYYGLAPEKTIVLFVGRVDREKRIDVLLRAMHTLGRTDIQLAIAGSGAAMDELQALAHALALGDQVRFIGYIHEDLHVLLNSVDLFAMASEAELLSLASLEAMACGRPLLLADALALPELVTPEVNGYLFPPGDSAAAARAIARFADSPERWAAMGQASLERVQYHSLENTIRRYEKLYADALVGKI
jgi:glycosyltransferase involved in cell wall biosynthesis